MRAQKMFVTAVRDTKLFEFQQRPQARANLRSNKKRTPRSRMESRNSRRHFEIRGELKYHLSPQKGQRTTPRRQLLVEGEQLLETICSIELRPKECDDVFPDSMPSA